MSGRAAVLGGLALSLVGAAPAAAQQDEAARERWQRVPEVVATLEIGPGSWVADVGAGAGFFTVRLAEAVGEQGRVIATDIGDSVLRRLRQRIERENLDNVEVRRGLASDPRLPTDSLDAILIVNALHEFTQPRAMLEGIRRGLKPEGRLVILDASPAASRRNSARAVQQRAHELASEFAAADLRRAGFEVVEVREPFVLARDSGRRTDWWMVVAVRPPDDSP